MIDMNIICELIEKASNAGTVAKINPDNMGFLEVAVTLV